MRATRIKDGQLKCHGMGPHVTTALDNGVLEHAESVAWLFRDQAATVCFRQNRGCRRDTGFLYRRGLLSWLGDLKHGDRQRATDAISCYNADAQETRCNNVSEPREDAQFKKDEVSALNWTLRKGFETDKKNYDSDPAAQPRNK